MVKGPTKSNALLILFPGYNTLDVNGPYETLRQVKYGDDKKEMFQITIAAEKNVTVSAEGMKIERDIPLDQKLIDGLGYYDMLIVPGGSLEKVNATIAANGLFIKLVKEFSELNARSDSLPRIMLSICTGAFFLSSVSVFNEARYCTTHWACYTDLAKLNAQVADLASTMDIEGKGHTVAPGIVLPARYVDSGTNQRQTRIISSGGISCGIDASLHVINIRAELLAGNGKGDDIVAGVAKLLDYPYRFTEGVVFDNEY